MGFDVPVKFLYKGRSRIRDGPCPRGICYVVGETSRDRPVRKRRDSVWSVEAAKHGARRSLPAQVQIQPHHWMELNPFGLRFFVCKMGIIIVLTS